MSTDRLKRRVLEEWRGLKENPDRPDRQAMVADVLQKILPKLGLSDRLNEQQMQAAWRDIVGDFLAEHSVPASLREGVLNVQVLQPSVRYELDRSWKKEVLGKLQARFGKKVIKDVRFR